jgi:hypothetical protein
MQTSTGRARGVHVGIPLIEDLPQVMGTVRSKPLFVMQLDVKPYQVLGGTFEGERLSGEILEGGNDWQFVRTDRATTLDVRLVLKTHDDALIGMSYKGIRYGAPEVIASLDRAEDVDPSTYYFRTNPLFETAAPRYDWINRILTIGVGYRRPNSVVYSVFEIL